MADMIEAPSTDSEVELFSGAPIRGHVPMLCNLAIGRPKENTKTEKMDISNIDWDTWKDDLDSTLKLKLLEGTTEDNLNPKFVWNCYKSSLDQALEQHGKRKTSSSHDKVFWTPDLTLLSKEHRDTRKSWNKRNTGDNKEKMDDAKQKFDDARRKACKAYLLEKTRDLNTTESHKFWKEFKKLFSGKGSNTVDALNDGDGGLVTDDARKEEILFNTFFKGEHLKDVEFDESFFEKVNKVYDSIKANNFEKMADTERSNDHQPPGTESYNEEITMEEIQLTIKNYATGGKSFDNDNFHPVMLKKLGTFALQTLHKLFNLCLDSGYWAWDTADVIFLKKADKRSYANPGALRPIAISSYIGKVYEKIAADRIESFLHQIGKFDPDQEGFTKGRNTIRYLNRLNLAIKGDIEKKLTVICLFLDFEKAFDSVPKKGMIYKLHQLGLRGKLLKLLDSFLFNKKVTLKFNGYVGFIRFCLEFGLPQGSALSPILFRIYVMDLADLVTEMLRRVKKIKFADDGTVIVAAKSTEECVATMKEVLRIVHEWSQRWRMVINCSPNKTELVCFNTAEKDISQIPSSLPLGDKPIMFVSETKVLGVIIDKDLTYKSHSKMIHKRLCHRWVTVCKHSNRNWGFSQRVMVQLIKTIFQSTLLYASHIWMNKKNMTEINVFWYKLLKSSVGAVLNVRQSLAGLILGLPPIEIVNRITLVKHYLKLSKKINTEDRLIEDIQECFSDGEIPSTLRHGLREVFNFLNWKLNCYPKKFSNIDVEVVKSNDLENIFALTPAATLYTKQLMISYTEHLWQSSVDNEFMLEGYTIIPKASCSTLQIERTVTRDEEVLLMSLFYQNNLLNSSLYKINTAKFTTGECECGDGLQTAYHIVMDCNLVSEARRQLCFKILEELIGVNDAEVSSCVTLLNGSRSPKFISALLDVVRTTKVNLRTKVTLASSKQKDSEACSSSTEQKTKKV